MLNLTSFFRRATALGFELIATGHHAQITRQPEGFRLSRSVDLRKDQSYVLHMLSEKQLASASTTHR